MSSVWFGTALVDGQVAEGLHHAIPVDRLRSLLTTWADEPSRGLEPCDLEGEEPPADDYTLDLILDVEDELAETLGAILWVHGESINQGVYEQAWELLTPAMRSRMRDLRTWSEGVASSFWVTLEILSVEQTGDEAIAVTELRTEQAADRGPKPGQTCSIWPMTYEFALVDGNWRIDRARLRAEPTECG
ncbi:MAG: hypothetical protein LCH96_02225 [Actinobacteria bacterium]|nr:hypothetical protein [Actinomycetota bacterium]